MHASLRQNSPDTEPSPAVRAFVEWARLALAPFTGVAPGPRSESWSALDAMIGDASVVALSEGVHGAAEPLEFRNRLLRHLVENKGFTAIAIESGVVESRAVHDFVRAPGGGLDEAIANGMGWGFDRLPQNRALVQWVKDYNADPLHARKVTFYGFDIAGSPGSTTARRGIDTAIVAALEYLAGVDAAAASGYRTRLAPLLKRIKFDVRRSPLGPGYEALSIAERDTLTATLADLVKLLECKEAKYISASTPRDHAWGHRAAVAACQVDAWLRHVPIGWQPFDESEEISAETFDFVAAAREVRDRAQADNIGWLLEQEGTDAKVLIFASLYHLSGAPIKAKALQPNSVAREHEVAGTYLRRRLGTKLISIGNLIGEGEVACGTFRQPLERAAPDSIEGCVGEIGTPLFMLDMRRAPPQASGWLAQEQPLARGPGLKVAFGRAFDVLLYMDVVTPACFVTGSYTS